MRPSDRSGPQQLTHTFTFRQSCLNRMALTLSLNKHPHDCFRPADKLLLNATVFRPQSQTHRHLCRPLTRPM